MSPVVRAAIGALAVAGLVWAGLRVRESQQARARIAASRARLSLDDEKGPEVQVARPGARLVYVARLEGVPLGGTLALGCRWLDPTGAMAHENLYATRTIDRSPWPTHCRWTLPPSAASGRWTVHMQMGDRTLVSTGFEVR